LGEPIFTPLIWVKTLPTLVNSVGTGNPTHCGTVADPVTAGAGSTGVPKNSAPSCFYWIYWKAFT